MDKKEKIQFSTMQLVLGSIIVALFFSIIGLLFFFEPPYENLQIINILIGSVCGAFVTIISYYFGSSKGSQDKTEAMQKLKDKEENI